MDLLDGTVLNVALPAVQADLGAVAAQAQWIYGAYALVLAALLLDLTDWARAYHGTNLERLVHAKERYDPENFFRFNQSIPSRVHARDAPEISSSAP